MASEEAGRIRVRVVYRGRVQGVGFRFTALQISGNFDVSGYVRNLPDGSVELEAEGAPATVDAFLESVADRLASSIRAQDRQTLPAASEIHTAAAFDIRL
ncbi:MAG: acylphosphatase [Planctomycetes bacterium]|nr:acylphosphatase [Planctomycetota bacterium]